MSEPTLSQFLDEIVRLLRDRPTASIGMNYELAALLVHAYDAADRKAEAARRLLTKRSEKGDMR